MTSAGSKRYPLPMWVTLAAQAMNPGKLPHHVESGHTQRNLDSCRCEKGQVKVKVVPNKKFGRLYDLRNAGGMSPQGSQPSDIAGRNAVHSLGSVPAAVPHCAKPFVKKYLSIPVDNRQGEHLVATRVEPCGLGIEDEQLLRSRAVHAAPILNSLSRVYSLSCGEPYACGGDASRLPHEGSRHGNRVIPMGVLST